MTFDYKYEFKRPKDDATFYVFVKKNIVHGEWSAMYSDGDIDYLESFDYLELYRDKEMEFCEVGSEVDECSVCINIHHVKFTKKNGICTYTVAAAIHALLDCLTKHKFINKNTDVTGQVTIKSKTPCIAFNCYNRAFEMNGFSMNEDCNLQARSLPKKEGTEEYLFEYTKVRNKLQQRLTTCMNDNICEERLGDLEEIHYQTVTTLTKTPVHTDL